MISVSGKYSLKTIEPTMSHLIEPGSACKSCLSYFKLTRVLLNMKLKKIIFSDATAPGLWETIAARSHRLTQCRKRCLSPPDYLG